MNSTVRMIIVVGVLLMLGFVFHEQIGRAWTRICFGGAARAENQTAKPAVVSSHRDNRTSSRVEEKTQTSQVSNGVAASDRSSSYFGSADRARKVVDRAAQNSE